ncbi:hypothetical protein PENTCL1PPCAC_3067, partial [Pristionchus entomophagus]
HPVLLSFLVAAATSCIPMRPTDAGIPAGPGPATPTCYSPTQTMTLPPCTKAQLSISGSSGTATCSGGKLLTYLPSAPGSVSAPIDSITCMNAVWMVMSGGQLTTAPNGFSICCN